MARRVRAARPHAPPAIRRVAILAKPGSREGVRIARELADWLHENKRNRFFLTAPPLNLPGSAGSPSTPVATV